jgi:cytochrome c2
VLNQRKYIILAFLIFSFIFAGIYFVMGFAAKKNDGWCGTESNYVSIDADTSKQHKDGKIIFQNKCAACHILGIDATGPNLIGFRERGPWSDKKKIFDYLTDPNKFLKNKSGKYVVDLYNSTPFVHPAFLISQEEVDALIRYLQAWAGPLP